jgi:phosphonopyruvate decarboxylase
MSGRMSAKNALGVVHDARNPRDVVVTTMTPARDWMLLPQSPLDVVLVPSAMGHATSIGLGIALAQPSRKVIVCNGDGSMVMNLGSLVSIVASGAANISVLVFENGTYEVTGSQPVPAAATTDFVSIARGAGFRSVFSFETVDAWQADIANVLATPGPVFVLLKVEPVIGQPGPKSPGPAVERGRRLREALSR